MRRSELQREENYNEYLRLKQNDDYYDVMYDEESGGVSAVHKQHKFGKQQGSGGLYRGDYEKIAVAVLRKKGHRVLLEEETNTPGIKSFDGYLDDAPMEIKAIEGNGSWSICSKLRYADKQRAHKVVLFFPESSLFSEERIVDGIGKYMAYPDIDKGMNINQIVAASKDGVLGVWNKKATPIEGWSDLEGFRR